jgi:5-methylcytosine-specific restriction endonuclease McrA
MRREFPAKVKAQAFERARGHCEKCTAHLYVGKFHFDHRIADAMGGEPVLENCEVLCVACHSVKTRTKDIPGAAKVKRIQRRHLGIKARSSFPKPPAGSRWDWKLGRRVLDSKGM